MGWCSCSLKCIKTGDGVSGRCPDRRVQGEGHSLSGDSRGGGPLPYPSGEPTTTEAKRVVIVGYNRASPASKSATLRSGFASFFSPLDLSLIMSSIWDIREEESVGTSAILAAESARPKGLQSPASTFLSVRK